MDTDVEKRPEEPENLLSESAGPKSVGALYDQKG